MNVAFHEKNRWSEAEKYQVHDLVFKHVAGVEYEQRDVHESNLCYATLYSNREEPGLRKSTRRSTQLAQVTENIIKQIIDAAGSLIAKSRPRLRVLTDGAAWSKQQMAKRLDKWLWGMFQALKVHDKMTMAFRDACIFGTGCLYVFERDGELHCERVLSDEIVIDEAECPSGQTPGQMHRVRKVSKTVLKRLYPDKADLIEAAGQTDIFDFVESRLVDPGMLCVIESWDLEAKRHTLCVDTATLVDESYDFDEYPFIWFKWTPPLTGFYGQGLAEELLGFQIRINDLNDFITKCQDLIAVPRVAVDIGSKLLKVQLNNEIGCVIPYVGKPPVFFTPTALNAEIYNYKERLKQSAFDQAGISEMLAHATKEPGIEAAVAMRELSDNQSQRFSIQQQRLEEAYVEVGYMLIRFARKMHKNKQAPSAFMAEKFVQTIDFPDVDDGNTRFVLQVMPSSMMNMTPAGKMQMVIELAQYGVPLSPAAIVRLLDLPDLEAENKALVSAREDAEWTVEELLEGRMVRPEPFQDIALTMERATAAYLDARRLKAPERILTTVRNYITLAAKDQAKKAQASAAAMGPVMPAPLRPLPAEALQKEALPGLATNAAF